MSDGAARGGAYRLVGAAVEEVRRRIEVAAARAGRDPAEVEVMAVTKLHPIEAVDAAYGAGIRRFGENRVQEAEEKYPDFLASRPDARLEMIGHLQGNKAKKAVRLFSRVESVDSTEILAELDKRSRAEGRRIEVLLELHTGEESKEGFRGVDELLRACDLLASRGDSGGEAGLVPRGLMTMAPFTQDRAAVRSSFRALASALRTVKGRFGFPGFDVLSMGMSNDFEIAVEEGATLLRLGTVLFGARS